MTMQFFYSSGETVHARIGQAPSHPACEFDYVKATVKESGEMDSRLSRAARADDGVAIAVLAIDAVAKHVKGWTITRPDGSAVEPSDKDAINRLDPILVRKVFETIKNGDEGDVAPEKPEEAGAALKNC